MEINLTRENFEREVINSESPVLVDFWAPWCGPCQRIVPSIEELANEYKGKIKVCKLNVEEVPEIATQYNIMSVPTLVIFKKHKIMDKKIGVIGKKELEKFIYPYIN